MHFQNYITYGQNPSPFKGYEIKRKKHEVNSLMIWFLLHQLIDLNHLLNPCLFLWLRIMYLMGYQQRRLKISKLLTNDMMNLYIALGQMGNLV